MTNEHIDNLTLHRIGDIMMGFDDDLTTPESKLFAIAQNIERWIESIKE